MNILVPIDFSEITDSVINEATLQSSAFDAEIVLLNVIQQIPNILLYEDALTYVPIETDFNEFKSQQEGILKSIKNRIQRKGIKCSVFSKSGEPAHEILNFCKENNVDRIVIGSHGHGALYHLVLGSISEKIVDKSKLPVTVVK